MLDDGRKKREMAYWGPVLTNPTAGLGRDSSLSEAVKISDSTDKDTISKSPELSPFESQQGTN